MRRSKSVLALLMGFLPLWAAGACSGEAVQRTDDLGPATVFTDDPAASDHEAGAGPAGGVGPEDAADAPPDAGSNAPPLDTKPATAELLISLTDGTVLWWRSGDTGLRRLESVVAGPAFAMAFDAASNLYVTHGYTANLKAGNAVEVFDREGSRVGSFGTTYDCNPHSIVFDAMGGVYIGQSDCSADILHLDATGALLDTFDVATEARGADWIALADDQCTMLYTSQGSNVKRYDVCTRTQLADFNVVALPVNATQGSGAQQVQFLPGGGVLVANFTEIVRLDAAGNQVGIYDVVGPDGWRGLDLDGDGTSFWVVNHETSDVARFDIASGETLERFNTGTAPLTLKSVLARRP